MQVGPAPGRTAPADAAGRQLPRPMPPAEFRRLRRAWAAPAPARWAGSRVAARPGDVHHMAAGDFLLLAAAQWRALLGFPGPPPSPA